MSVRTIEFSQGQAICWNDHRPIDVLRKKYPTMQMSLRSNDVPRSTLVGVEYCRVWDIGPNPKDYDRIATLVEVTT